ncbi:MAG: hypothetical protein ACRDZ3_01890 [Acidimicrobiia bacterium]
MIRRRQVGFGGSTGQSGGEVGFPGKLGGVAEEPVAAPFDGGLDVGDVGDGPFRFGEASVAPLELRGRAGQFGSPAIRTRPPGPSWAVAPVAA